MTDINLGGTWRFDGTTPVHRMGYGAMQLAGPHVFGPPADPANSVAVLRRVVELGINHIDTSDFYGPFVVNELIRQALHPYADDLVLVTKVGARRDEQGAWLPADEPDELRQAVHDNLKRLDVPMIHLVNLRIGTAGAGADLGPIGPRFEVLAKLQQEGLIRHLGVSNVTAEQFEQARAIAPVAQVQNMYNIVQRQDDDLVDRCAELGVAYVPFFPLGGFQPLQAQALGAVAARHGVSDRQIALAWLLARSPSILLIPGTASIAHLEDNVAAAGITLSEQDHAELDNL